jgi:pimeloyl-ACP methyl ester carboxylesterase
MIDKLLYQIALFIGKTILQLKKEYILVDRYMIAYYRSLNFSSKDTIILIHGLNDRKESYFSLIKKLNGFNIIAIDLLGSGDSSKPLDFDYSIASQAKFLKSSLLAIKKKHNIDTFLLAGHSMGGALALICANEFYLKKVILFAPYGIEVNEPKIKQRAKKEGKDIWKNVCLVEKFKMILNDMYYKVPAFPKYLLNYITQEKCKDAELEAKKIDALVDDNLHMRDNLSNIASKIKCPALIFWGEDDKIIDISSAYKYSQLIKNSKLYTFRECGHMVHIERAKDIAKRLNS